MDNKGMMARENAANKGDRERLGSWERHLDQATAVLFYVGLFLELAVVILDKSSWTNPYEGLMYRAAFVLFAVRCAACVRNSDRNENIVLVLALAAALLSWHFGGRNDLIRVVVFVRAAGTMNVRKAMKFSFFATLAGCAVLVMLALTGVMGHLYQTYDYGHGVETRWDLGLGHPNSLHCMAAMVLLLALYLYEKNLKLHVYVLLAVGDVLLYGLTHSNTGFIIAMFAIVLSALLHYSRRLSDSDAVYYLGELLAAGCLAFSVLCGLYNPSSHRWMSLIDRLLTGRVSSMWTTTFHEGTLSTWKWFSAGWNTCYFDLGWIRVIYWYGVIPAVLIAAVLFLMLEHARKTRDRAAFVMLISMTVYTVFEAHLVSAYIGRNYGLFLAALYLPAIIRGTGYHES